MPVIRKKFVLVGDSGCGKTSLLFAIGRGDFFEEDMPTLFDSFVTEIEIDNIQFEVTLWDTAGQEAYDQLRELSYQDADVILLCYSIDNHDSFYNIEDKWLPEVRHFCPNVPFILVGNKSEVRTDLDKSMEKIVLEREVRAMADKICAFSYIDCSAKTQDGLHELIVLATMATLLKKKEKTTTKCSLL